MYADGFKYWLAYKTNTTSYYRCCRYLTAKCPGRCVSEEGKIRNTTPHNHSAEPDRALIDKFRKILTHRAATEKTELYAIYCDEATARHSDAAMLYPFTSAESAMRKARRKQMPQAPNTMTDIVEILDHSELFRVNSGSNKDPIYQKTITLEDSACMIFMHKKTFELFGRIDEIHIDGSFDIFSHNPPSYYLITIHAVQGYITAPIIYTLFTAKTQSAYASLFSYIREELNILPNMIMSDFDQTMQTSLAYTFPESIIKGSWFHYIDAVLCEMKNLNLQRETAKGVGASALRMLLVLPLLPAEYMSPGLEALKKWMKEKNIFSKPLSSLCDYVEHGWLRAVGAEKMSIFGTPKSVSNHVKNFNKELANVIGVQNPIIWIILESITQIATKTYVKVNKRMKAAKAAISNVPNNQSGSKSQTSQLGRSQRKSELVTDTIISSATQLWIKTPVHLRNPLQFLQLSSHCINDTIYLANLSDLKTKTNSSISTTITNLPPKWGQQMQLPQQQQQMQLPQQQQQIQLPQQQQQMQLAQQQIQLPQQQPQQIQINTQQQMQLNQQQQQIQLPQQQMQLSQQQQQVLVPQPQQQMQQQQILPQQQMQLVQQQGQILLPQQQQQLQIPQQRMQISQQQQQQMQLAPQQQQLSINYMQTEQMQPSNSYNCNGGQEFIMVDTQELHPHNMMSQQNSYSSCFVSDSHPHSHSMVAPINTSQEEHHQQHSHPMVAQINTSHEDQHHQHHQHQHHPAQQPVQFKPIVSSDPPPLAFFPSVKRIAAKRRLPLLSEPPPLVPITPNRLRKLT